MTFIGNTLKYFCNVLSKETRIIGWLNRLYTEELLKIKVCFVKLSSVVFF